MKVRPSPWPSPLPTVLACAPHKCPAPLALPGAPAVALMRRWRAALHAADPAWTAGWAGWAPDSEAHPCSWDHVRCDRQLRINRIQMPLEEEAPGGQLAGGGNGTLAPRVPAAVGAGDSSAAAAAQPAGPSPLLPELAGLQHLEALDIVYARGALPSGLPPEWCQRPGAFPRLQQCVAREAVGGACATWS